MEQIPPFYVGQEVQAVESHSKGYYKKGERYTVTNVERDECKCNTFSIDIGINEYWPYGWWCDTCAYSTTEPSKSAFPSTHFRAITPNFESISFTQVVEENLVSVN